MISKELAGKSSAEEVDLGYIDLFEPDSSHSRQAHENTKFATMGYHVSNLHKITGYKKNRTKNNNKAIR
jgi:hypothetical protein